MTNLKTPAIGGGFSFSFGCHIVFSRPFESFQSRMIGNFKGEVSEWLKEHAWKVCIPLKGIAGSNPALSANETRNC